MQPVRYLCGWGAAMQRALQRYDVNVIGRKP